MILKRQESTLQVQPFNIYHKMLLLFLAIFNDTCMNCIVIEFDEQNKNLEMEYRNLPSEWFRRNTKANSI